MIIVDSREKPKAIRRILDYFDEHGVQYMISKMLFGDYMEYNHPAVVVDRKQNIAELAKNCTIEHERFRRELQRAKDCNATLIILVEQNRYIDRGEMVKVETIQDLLRWSSSHTQVRGEKIFRVLASWSAKYPIKVVFCDKRSTGKVIRKMLIDDSENREG